MIHPIKKLKEAYALFIATFQNLADCIKDNTVTVMVSNAAQARRQKEMLAALAEVEKHLRYLATAERHNLQRQGHRSSF